MNETMTETRPGARQRLAKEKEANPSPPDRLPKFLPVGLIEEEPLVFQPRSGMDDDHAQDILAGILRGSSTDPIDVWWSGTRWVLLDGHHRVAAYRTLGERADGPQKVPVRCHAHLSLEEAHALSLSQNSRDKKNMTAEEKTGAAWALVCIGDRTKQEQAALSSVATRTIANMRSVFKVLIERGFSKESLEVMGWEAARARARGTRKADYSGGAMEAWAQEWAGKLDRALSVKAIENPDVLARALAIWSAELPSRLLQTDSFADALQGAGRAILEEALEDSEGMEVF